MLFPVRLILFSCEGAGGYCSVVRSFGHDSVVALYAVERASVLAGMYCDWAGPLEWRGVGHTSQ